MRDITPIFEFNPPVTFEKAVSVTMRTCISAPAGKTITASLLTRYHPEEQWQETMKLVLGQKNQVNFRTFQCGGIKVAAECSGAILHLINGFHVNLSNRMMALTYSKDQAVHDIVKKSMQQNGFIDFAVSTHDVQGKYGSKFSVSMKKRESKDGTVSRAYPSPTFTLDEDYLQKGKHIVYFEYAPEPSDECGTIGMQYEYKVDGQLEQRIPLRIKWPRKDTKKADPVVEEVEERKTSRFNLATKFKKLWR